MSLSPAERFAAARARRDSPELERFRERQRFDLDPFQLEACRALESGQSVLVAAPTGAGKTIIAEFAVHLALQDDRAKIFYTTPMKALSNQKFGELVREYGEDSVGLLTGDTSINPRARVVVMTTEVLRNMLYAESPLLADLAFVIMDEVHYLADRARGAVWEEVIIHLSSAVRLVSLSATVSNAEEFGDWLQTVRGSTAVIVSEERPVPLHQHLLHRGRLLELFDPTAPEGSPRVNPELLRLTGSSDLRERQRQRGHRQHGPRRGGDRVDRPALVELLGERRLLPAIFFIFSRAGCDAAVEQVAGSGLRLTSPEERSEIRRIVENRTRELPDPDLGVLGYHGWLDALTRGIAAHHAGLIPAFKETVEELFQRRLLKVVFATETLALGVNMPARTVVVERLEKFNGEARVPITPGEYTQLTGRAGRRGIDVEGHAVVAAGSIDPAAVAALASRRSYPLASSFRPTYNMTVNLVEQYGRDRARELLESSFGQFQADRAVVGLARRVRSQEESLAGYAEAMQCHLGDFADYSALRRELSDLERGEGRKGRGAQAREQKIADLRRRMRRHPCHACAEREQHARWAERWWKLHRETEKLRHQINDRTGAVAAVFERIGELLRDLDYLEERDGRWGATSAGRMLQRIYGERDLLVAEALRRGAWTKLDAPGLAAMASTLVFEPRREDYEPDARRLPPGAFRNALEHTEQLWAELTELEERRRLPRTDPLAAGIALATYRWAQGSRLDDVLRESQLAAGDFVRWMKQAIDLLDQLSLVADGGLGRTARQAIDRTRRGIVAYTGTI